MDYDIGKAFEEIEDELIASMIRNLKRHQVQEVSEGKQWTQWQAEQLAALERYRRNNQTKFSDSFNHINQQIRTALQDSYNDGSTKQERQILQAIKRGYKQTGTNAPNIPNSVTTTGEFFRTNERKMNALIEATTHDMQRAETAVLRMSDDQYRKIIFNAQVYANSGAGTYAQAVDMATKDFLSAGINCIEYRNGRRVNIKSYAEMALRTANKRAYLQGEGERRKEWGISTVIVQPRGNPCPLCLPFVGKVFVDDVWSGGTREEAERLGYPLMSDAIAAGLYHPNCKDVHTTYFEGLDDDEVKDATEAERDAAVEDYKQEQQRNYVENQAEKYERLSEYSLDPDSQQKYSVKAEQWRDNVHRIIDPDIKEKADMDSGLVENLSRSENVVEKSDESSIIKSELGIFKKRIRADERMSKEYYAAVKDKFSHGSDVAKEAFNKFIPTNSVFDTNFEGTPHFDPSTKQIYMHYFADLTNERGACATWFHEHGHMVDNLAGGLSNNEEFSKLLHSDYMEYMKEYGKNNGLDTFDKVQNAISKDLNDMRKHSAVADILEGLSDCNIQGIAGHGRTYWSNSSNLASEAFAHMFEAQFDRVRYEEIKKYFPNALSKFEEILREAVKDD